MLKPMLTEKGRPIRMLLGILGMDQHEAGAFAVAAMLRDAGIEVIYDGRFGLPESIVEAAIQEGVDVIGLSCHSWEYLYYLDELKEVLQRRDCALPVVLGGSVLSRADRSEVTAKGIAATFGPGTPVEEMVREIHALVSAQESGC